MITSQNWSFATLQKQYRAPHHLYDALRESEPIFYDRAGHCLLVTSRRAITHMLRDGRFVSHPPLTPVPKRAGGSLLKEQLLFFSGARHAKAHAVVQEALNRLVSAKKTSQVISRITNERLAQAVAREQMEVVADFARPVAGSVSAYILGLPIESDDLATWFAWSDAFADQTSGFGASALPIYQLHHTFLRVIALRQSQSTTPGDLLDALLSAPECFPNEEVIAINMQMLFAAGRVTIEKTIAQGIRLLAEAPERWQRLRAEAATNAHLAHRLTEEWLRLITPTRFLKRWATEDVDLSSAFTLAPTIRRGQEVVLYLEAANRDPVEFADPHRFDQDRRPNRHIAFGYGPHLCPGAGLARLVLRLVIEALVRQIDALVPLDAETVYAYNPNLGGMRSYRVALPGRGESGEHKYNRGGKPCITV
jgi:cytochrome P450